MIPIRNLLVAALFFSVLPVISMGCQPAEKQVVAEMPTSTKPVNTAPLISEMSATDSLVQPQGKTRIVCKATDAENDILTYKWTATAGIIEGDGNSIIWTAPAAGGDTSISVTVSDGKGGDATKNVIIKVPEKPNNPPTIKSLRFTRVDHKPVIINPTGTAKELQDVQALLVVKKMDWAELSVLPADPDNDPLDYSWTSIPGGTIKGSGATVKWIAPNEASDYKITVEVSDGKGGVATYTITVTVKCCGV
jgi:hypothetical protein